MTRQPLSVISSLAEAREQGIHLDEEFPILVRHGIVREGEKIDPPVYHPFLELGIRFQGEERLCIEGQILRRRPYDVFLGSIGLPHWGTVERYPMEFVSVYFLPSVFSDWGNQEESLAVLNRFFAPQPPRNRLVRPSPELQRRLASGFREMVAEFEREQFGRRFKLQSLLIGMLVDLLRREKSCGRALLPATSKSEQWKTVILAMRYIRQHFSEPVYAPEVAAVASVSVTGLKIAFQETIQMPWVKYLQSYRIHRAALLLQERRRNVTEVALAVGFQSLSHFNRTFKTFTGKTPGEKGKKKNQKGETKTPSRA
jgi:AraC-like DNA-binding protein